MTYTVQYGCDEWQDEHMCEVLDEAQEFANNPANMIMGLYPADYCYIEDENRRVVETIIENDGLDGIFEEVDDE